MNLSFKTHINQKPTYFVEKIIDSLPIVPNYRPLYEYYARFPGYPRYTGTYLRPKKHSIRDDPKDRWKVGIKIHFIINNRTPDRYQFLPVYEVKSIQKIEIRNVFGDKDSVLIDGSKIPNFLIEDLAINDGFESVDDFWDYFEGGDYIRKIIHWTYFKY